MGFFDDAKDNVKDVADDVKDNAQQAASNAQDAASDAAAKVKDVTGDAVDNAKDFAGDVKENVGEKVEDAKDAFEEKKDDVQDAIGVLAKKYEATRGQIALAWLRTHPAGIIPVVGSNNPSHIFEAAQRTDLRLTHEEWYSVFAASWGRNMP